MFFWALCLFFVVVVVVSFVCLFCLFVCLFVFLFLSLNIAQNFAGKFYYYRRKQNAPAWVGNIVGSVLLCN